REFGAADLAAAGELWPLLCPRRDRARERPRRAEAFVIARPADQRGVAFGRGQSHARAEFARGSGAADLFTAGELWPLLGPGGARARERPRRAEAFVVARPPDHRGGAAFGREHRHGRRQPARGFGAADLSAAGEL